MTHPPPLITIAVPTRNRSALVAGQVARISHAVSIHARPGEVELILGDNASDDDTREVLQRTVAGSGVLWRIMTHPSNLGLVGNLLALVHAAMGRYVWLVGDDDVIHDECLPRVLAALRGDGCGLLFINHRAVGLDGIVGMASALPDHPDPSPMQVLRNSGTTLMFISACVYRRADLIDVIDQDPLPHRRLSAPLWWSLATAARGGFAVIRQVSVDNVWGNVSWSAQRWRVFMLLVPREILESVRLGYPLGDVLVCFLHYWKWRFARAVGRLRGRTGE